MFEGHDDKQQMQPPFDTQLGNTFIIHFTYGCDYSLKVLESQTADFLLYILFSMKLICLCRVCYCSGYSTGIKYSIIIIFQGELTYGKIGEWRFDKRSFSDGPPPRNLTLPPPGVPESVVRVLSQKLETCATYLL